MVFNELKNWVGVGAINIDFGRERKAHIELCRTEMLNLCIVAWFLVPKLVTRKAKYYKAEGSKFFMKFLKPLVLRSEATFARRIDNENGLTSKGLKVNFVTVDIVEAQGV